MSALQSLLAGQRRAERPRLIRAALLAALVAASSVLLLGLSGWFIAASAVVGVTGVAAAQAFNYMLPSATIRLLAIVRTGSRYGERLIGHSAALHALARVRPALFAGIAAAPAAQALAIGSGEATARLVGDIDALENRFVRLSAPWGAGAGLIAGLCLTALAGVAPMLATLAIAALLILAARAVATRLEVPGREVRRAAGVLRQELALAFDNAAELRCFALEDMARGRINAASATLTAAQRAEAEVMAGFEALHALAVALAATCALALAWPAGQALAALSGLAAAMALDGLGATIRDLAQQGRVREAEARIEPLLAHPPVERAGVVAREVAVHGVTIAQGGRLQITGRSGAGKTRIVETLLGLRSAEHGTCQIDGIDLATLPEGAGRPSFAWLPQDAQLIAGTLADNLRLARPDAGEDDLRAALHDAALEDVALTQWLGDNGALLSGGERRRVALARAYLAEAPFLLLDEPGEALDSATAALVAERLAARLARTGQGLILVSHQPLFAGLCDLVIAVEPSP